MNSIKIIIMACALYLPCIFATPIGQTIFGNKDASLVVSDDSYVKITPTKGVTITGGNFANTGSGIVEGNPIKFDFGTYTLFNSRVDLNGVLIPDSTGGGTIKIGGDSPNGFGVMIANPGGLASIKVEAESAEGGSIMRGQPLFFGENDLTLQNSNTLFNVAVQNAVNTNITLNGGILRLQDDLLLGDSAVIKGDGYVLLNNRRLSLGGQAAAWTGNIGWFSALDIQLNSAVSLPGKWTFFDSSQLNGNGNVLDLAGGGELIVAPGSILRMASVQIKGLGKRSDLGKIRLGDGATLFLSDVVIEMDDDYDVVSGTWYVEGSSKVITKDHILNFKDSDNGSTHGRLTVDRVDLTYDTLATLDKVNIQPTLINDPQRKYIHVLQSGDIRTIKGDTVTFHNYRADSLLQKYAIVAPYRKFVVYPELNDTIQNFDVLIDGNTNFLGFTRCDDAVFIVSPGVRATTQNMIIRDVSTKNIAIQKTLEHPDTSLTFGNKTMVTFARNEVLDYPWVFEGSTILRGGGMVLELQGEGAIILKGTNSRLLLDGIILKGINGTNVRCEDNTSTIQMRGVKWIQSDDFTFEKGSIELVDDVTMVGPHTFTYSSQQPFSILSDATFSLCRNLIFNWLGTPRGLVLAANGTAAIQLDQATLVAPQGLTTTTPGRLIVRNKNYNQNDKVNFNSLEKDYSGSFK